MDPTKCGVPNQIRTRVSAVAEGGLAVALPAAAVAAGDWRLPALDSLLMLFSLSLNYTVSLREAFGRIVRVGHVGGRRMVLWLSHGWTSVRRRKPTVSRPVGVRCSELHTVPASSAPSSTCRGKRLVVGDNRTRRRTMKNQVTFNLRALWTTAIFAATVALASYAQTRRWWMAAPLAWLLHGIVGGDLRRGGLGGQRPDAS